MISAQLAKDQTQEGRAHQNHLVSQVTRQKIGADASEDTSWQTGAPAATAG